MLRVGAGTSRPRRSSVARAGEATATRRRRPRERVGLTRMTRMTRIRKRRREWRQKWRCPAQRRCPPCAASRSSAKSAKSAVPSLAGHACAVPLGSARRSSAFRLRGRERRPADHADARRTGRVRIAPRRASLPIRGRGRGEGGGRAAAAATRRRLPEGFSGSKNVRECQRIRQTQLRSSGESPLLSTWMKWSRWRTEWGFNRSRRGFHARRKVSRSGIPAGGGSLK